MRLLLDTHIFIWWDSEPHRVPVPILTLCEDLTNTLVLSVASVWEIQIKLQLGKLQLDLPLSDVTADPIFRLYPLRNPLPFDGT